MLPLALYLISFFFHLSTIATPVPYSPTDYFLLNCGSSSNTISSDGRNWDGDARSKFSPSNMADTSSASTATEQDPSVTTVPYMTARIFNYSQFTYTFPVSAGPKFVRLYFYPATYSGLDKTKSFFSVSAADYTLLSNFSAFLTVAATVTSTETQEASVIKEFIVNVKDNQMLNITFSPSPNSYAFVNGIEVVSMPTSLYIRGDDHPVKLVDPNSASSYVVENNTALETLYRLNVGGGDLHNTEDTGMFRTWRQDDLYIYGQAVGLTPHREVPILYTTDTPPYTAPTMVYTTSRTMGKFEGNVTSNYNLTWVFTVDSGFDYLVRLHFCEIQLEVTRENQRIFSIFLNNQTADIEVDVIHLSGGTGIPVFIDYIIWVPQSGGHRSKQDLWLALHPNMDSKPKYSDAILNGLEIFKLNQSNGGLAGPNPELVVAPTPPVPYPKLPEQSKSKGSFPVVAVLGGVLGGIAVLSVLGFLIFRRRSRAKYFGATSLTKSSWVPISNTSKSTNTSASSALPSGLCRHFSLAEIKSATCNFEDNFVIGTGGFGDVYKGYIDNATVTVAIKRLNPSSNQGAREFHTEIGMLSKLRHLHLVSLIGYCDDEGEMILVYDYMAYGTLRDHLYKTKNPPLPWKQRLQICIGAARGLHYLHSGAEHTIIHRDVKSTNILLDEKWVAKVSDFGLSKMGPIDNSRTHVSTVVKGSFGYVDPEYFRRQRLTDKSDVYSFGVVLFEVLCARPAIIASLPKEQVSLAQWGRYCFRKGTLDRILDPHLRGQIAPECLIKYGEIAVSCTNDHGIERPAMNDVVWGLEFALQLQDAIEKNTNRGDGVGTGDRMDECGEAQLLSPCGGATTTDDDEDVFSGSAEHVSVYKSSGESSVSSGGRSIMGYCHDGFNAETVFSEMINPKGR
uniref:Putative receptor-like protein kinase FERONIA n=1 Tax=Davidia involucrata TaxID=16924 RepID=A0A5B7BWN9_DAVIN